MKISVSSHSRFRLRKSSYNYVSRVLINSLCALIYFPRALANPLGTLVYFLRNLVDTLLCRRLSITSGNPYDGVFGAYPVVRDGISQFLDEAVQGTDMVNVFQELHKSVLFAQWSELCNNSSQLPANNQLGSVIHQRPLAEEDELA